MQAQLAREDLEIIIVTTLVAPTARGASLVMRDSRVQPEGLVRGVAARQVGSIPAALLYQDVAHVGMRERLLGRGRMSASLEKLPSSWEGVVVATPPGASMPNGMIMYNRRNV